MLSPRAPLDIDARLSEFTEGLERDFLAFLAHEPDTVPQSPRKPREGHRELKEAGHWVKADPSKRMSMLLHPSDREKFIAWGKSKAKRKKLIENRAKIGLLCPSDKTPTEPGYHYHATNLERAIEIVQSGKLVPHRPSYGTDQHAWPDGGTERRSYFTPTANTAWYFAPEEGAAVLLRAHESAVDFKRESTTGDTFAQEPIPMKNIEIGLADGSWVSLSDVF